MPAIRNHFRLWGTGLNAKGIFGGTVSGNDLDVRMLSKPLFNNLCGSFEQHIDHLMFFQVDQDRSVIAPFFSAQSSIPSIRTSSIGAGVTRRMMRMSVSPLV